MYGARRVARFKRQGCSIAALSHMVDGNGRVIRLERHGVLDQIILSVCCDWTPPSSQNMYSSSVSCPKEQRCLSWMILYVNGRRATNSQGDNCDTLDTQGCGGDDGRPAHGFSHDLCLEKTVHYRELS